MNYTYTAEREVVLRSNTLINTKLPELYVMKPEPLCDFVKKLGNVTSVLMYSKYDP